MEILRARTGEVLCLLLCMPTISLTTIIESHLIFVSPKDEQARAAPPKKVAENFVEFVTFCSLRNKITKMGLKKHTEDARKVVDEVDDDWDDDEPEEDPDSPLLPAKIFRPFANNSSM